jgi:hypothetical protein
MLNDCNALRSRYIVVQSDGLYEKTKTVKYWFRTLQEHGMERLCFRAVGI